MTKPAYFILEIDIKDEEAMKPYLERVGATVAPFALQMLVNGNRIDALEGTAPRGKILVARFASMETARAWYDSPAYREILGHRLSAAENRSFLVEGLEA